jgi:hypothetical protein
MSRRKATLPALLCIDVEPNDREVAGDPAADWSATAPCVDLLEDFRIKASAPGAPVHLNWFLRLDPQVRDAYGRADYAHARFRSRWDSAEAAGDGFGVHTHAWRKRAESWIADHGDTAWVRYCVAESLDAFEQAHGRPARMFRFGDHFQSNDVVRYLERRGVRYELTLEPGKPAAPALREGECSTGGLPDYTGLPRQPYFPSRLDYRRPGRWWPRRVRMIPVSTGCVDGDGVLPKSGGRYVHLNLAVDHVWMARICEGLLADPSTTHVCWVARTGDYAFPAYRANFRANLDYLAERGLRFVRPDEAWDEAWD